MDFPIDGQQKATTVVSVPDCWDAANHSRLKAARVIASLNELL